MNIVKISGVRACAAGLTLSFVLFGVPHRVISQASYIVTLPGDTLKGALYFAEAQGNLEKLFIASLDGKKRSFNATQVRLVSHESNTYRSINHDGYKFMKVAKEGYLSLLLFRSPGEHSFSQSFLYKRDGNQVEVPKINFKKIISKFLIDCSDVSQRVRNRELVSKDLEVIIDEYNQCIWASESTLGKKITPDEEVEEVKPDRKERISQLLVDLRNTHNKLNLQLADFVAIMNDIESKVSLSRPVPAYLLEALKASVNENVELFQLANELESSLKEED